MGSFKKLSLDTIKYSVRASQAVLQYGVGAMVDFEDQTLMTADSKFWSKENRKKIRDERLENALKVNHFYTPCVKNGKGNDNGYGIAYTRFPEWYFCPNCRKFKRITDWITYNNNDSKNPKLFENDHYMINSLKCGDCTCDLVVARVVIACEKGHIDDFPWVEWAHSQNFSGAKDICKKPDLEYSIAKTASAGLDSVIVKCNTCGSSASLKKAFDPGKGFNNVFRKIENDSNGKYCFRCSGRHPWKNTHENCLCYPKAMQRGASSIYFPVVDTSIIIPPYSSQLRKKIIESEAYADFEKELSFCQEHNLPDAISTLPAKYADKINAETGVDSETIVNILNEKIVPQNTENSSQESTRGDYYRYEEYLALTGEESTTDEFDDFQCEVVDINTYKNIPYISKISLIRKMREVQAHVGFSRIEPTDPTESADNQPTIVQVKAEISGESWYPACEVKGEGIFIEFNDDYIQKWLNGNFEVKDRVYKLNKRYKESYLGKNNKRFITPKFVLLHTFSHLLIKKLSFECGYDISSLKERIYCSDGKDGKYKMNGILVYTASGDSEGTLGGLVRQGENDVFPEILNKTVESSFYCSNDPVCSLSQGQGHESLNMGACYACSLIPETSCEEFNIFLDRGMLTGRIDNRTFGFFNMFKAFSDDNVEKNTPSGLVSRAVFNPLPKHQSDSMTGALEVIKADVDDEAVINIIDILIKYSSEHEYESPYMDSVISINNIDIWPDLIWSKSKTAWFLPGHEDGYSQLSQSEWKCYMLCKDAVPEELLKNIKEN